MFIESIRNQVLQRYMRAEVKYTIGKEKADNSIIAIKRIYGLDRYFRFKMSY